MSAEIINQSVAVDSVIATVVDPILTTVVVEEATKSVIVGLTGSLLAMMYWINQINALQSIFSALAAKEAQEIADLSKNESEALNEINEQIKNLDATQSDYQSALAALQEQYSQTQQSYDTKINQIQTRMQAKTTFISDLAKMTTGDYTNLGSLCQILANLASALR